MLGQFRVPTLPAVEIIKQRFLRPPSVEEWNGHHHRFRVWDYFLGLDGARYDHERGQCYAPLIYRPDAQVSSAEVRRYFRERGFSGNVAAHLEWTHLHQPMGYHATIPDNNRLLQVEEHLYAPYFYRPYETKKGEILLNRIEDGWGKGCSFVGYRWVE